MQCPQVTAGIPPAPRGGHTLTLVGDKLLILGGGQLSLDVESGWQVRLFHSHTSTRTHSIPRPSTHTHPSPHPHSHLRGRQAADPGQRARAPTHTPPPTPLHPYPSTHASPPTHLHSHISTRTPPPTRGAAWLDTTTGAHLAWRSVARHHRAGARRVSRPDTPISPGSTACGSSSPTSCHPSTDSPSTNYPSTNPGTRLAWRGLARHDNMGVRRAAVARRRAGAARRPHGPPHRVRAAAMKGTAQLYHHLRNSAVHFTVHCVARTALYCILLYTADRSRAMASRPTSSGAHSVVCSALQCIARCVVLHST